MDKQISKKITVVKKSGPLWKRQGKGGGEHIWPSSKIERDVVLSSANKRKNKEGAIPLSGKNFGGGTETLKKLLRTKKKPLAITQKNPQKPP